MRSARRHAVDIERGIGLGKSGSLLLELDSGDPSKTDYSTFFFSAPACGHTILQDSKSIDGVGLDQTIFVFFSRIVVSMV